MIVNHEAHLANVKVEVTNYYNKVELLDSYTFERPISSMRLPLKSEAVEYRITNVCFA